MILAPTYSLLPSTRTYTMLFSQNSYRKGSLMHKKRLFKGLRPPAAGPPEQGGHEDTRPRGYEATGLEHHLEAWGLLGGLLGPSSRQGPPGGLLGPSWGPSGPLPWGPLGALLEASGSLPPGSLLGSGGRFSAQKWPNMLYFQWFWGRPGDPP